MPDTPNPKRVLVVDGDLDTLVVVGKALSKLGLDGLPAATSAQARLIVMDLGGVHAAIVAQTLPDGDGLQLARELRRAFGCRIAIVSGHRVPDDGLPDGVDAWFLKPVRLNELLDAVRDLVPR